MMKKLEEVVELAGSCFHNMMKSYLEEPKKETIGDLIGKKIKGTFLMTNAYPIKTSKKTEGSVWYGDDKAIERIRTYDKLVNNRGGLGSRHIGFYHHHYYKKDEKRPDGLSPKDLDCDKEHFEKYNSNYCINIVQCSRIKNYEKDRRHKAGEFLTKYKRKLRVIYRESPFHAYDVIYSAYKVWKDNGKLKLKEIKIRKPEFKVKRILQS